MVLNLKGDELRAALSKLRVCLTQGRDDEAVGKELGLAWDEVLELKRRFYDHEAELLRGRSTEHTYVRFAVEQRQCLTDLDNVIAEYKEKKNAAAMVAAIRAKSDILERVLKMGLDLGLVDRNTNGKGYAAGEAIKQMANTELRQYIVAEINVFNQMMVRYGDQGMLQIAAGPVYRTAQTKKFPVKGHVRSKVYGGRRVVKGGSEKS